MSRSPSGKSLFATLTRRKFLQAGFAIGSLAEAVPCAAIARAGSVAEIEGRESAVVAEDMRSSQNTVLQPQGGLVEKLRAGAKAFSDADLVLTSLPEEFQERSYILSLRGGVRATCTGSGHVYAITAAGGEQASRLLDAGFRLLDFPAFPIFAGDSNVKAAAYQKRVEGGDKLEFGNWVILIFGPEELGGVPYAQMRSLPTPAFLPDGSEFKTWEASLTFAKTYYVDQAHPQASDRNPGTGDQPFKTINRAAQVVGPGERVLVGAGVYRECVRPAGGGTDPQHMISYEAAPGAKVVIKGSEVLKTKWVKSASPAPRGKDIWTTRLPPEMFDGYNPFGTANYRQIDQISYWNLSEVFADAKARLYLQVCGLLFQNGRRLRQVTNYSDLAKDEGAFWVEIDGLTIHVTTYGGVDANQAEWEATAREQIFAPLAYNLGFIRVKGFVMEHAGNTFPFPQRGAISTMMGHHWIIEGNEVRWANGVGIDIGDQAQSTPPRPAIVGFHIVRANTLEDIGITGVTAPGPIGSLIEDNVFRRNAWHDFEMLAECAAIKTHHNLNVLMRRNIILDTLHGTGIYIDSSNSNSRICQNLIAFTGSDVPIVDGTGGIYVEAALAPNLVDHNFVWGSTKANGIFVYTSSKVMIANNLVGNCATAGIRVIDPPGRKLGDREIAGGGNTAWGNILVDNGWNIGFYSAADRSDYNLLGLARLPHPFHTNSLGKVSFPVNAVGTKDAGVDLSDWRSRFQFDLHSSKAEVAAEFDPEKLELVWSVRGDFQEGPSIEILNRDFWNRPNARPTATPGPFGQIPREATRKKIDPRVRPA
jgi:hypothetical protein